MGGFSRLKRQPSLHGLTSRMSLFMSQDLDLPWTTSKDNNNSLQYPTKSSSTVLGKSNSNKSKSKSNKSKGTGRLLPFKSNKKISIITRGVSPTITVISETSSSSSSSHSAEEEGEGFEVDVNILPSDDTVYNNLDNSDYNNTHSNASEELSSAHSGSLTTFANNCSAPIVIPSNFNIEMDIVSTRNNGGDGIIESLSSLDKSSKSRRSSSPKSVRSRLTVTPIVEFCTDNIDETLLGSVKKEDLSQVNDEIGNLESEVVMESTSNNNKDMKEKICHILVDELGSSIETLRSSGSVLSTNTSASSSSSSEQPKMFILPNELDNGDSNIEITEW